MAEPWSKKLMAEPSWRSRGLGRRSRKSKRVQGATHAAAQSLVDHLVLLDAGLSGEG
jgi:hypothetical protein